MYYESWANRRPARGYNLCKKRVQRVLELAGLQGTDWEWAFNQSTMTTSEAVVPVEMGQGWDYARLRSFLRATKCHVCQRQGGIASKCAPCGKLLCLGCKYSCDGDVHGLNSHCAFAVCQGDFNATEPDGLSGFYDLIVEGSWDDEAKPEPALSMWNNAGEFMGRDDAINGVCPHHRGRAGYVNQPALSCLLNRDGNTRKRLVGGAIVQASEVQASKVQAELFQQ